MFSFKICTLAPRLFSVSHKILCLSRYCWWNKAVLSSYFLEQLRMFGFVGIMRELCSLVTEQWNNTCPIYSYGWSHSIQWVFFLDCSPLGGDFEGYAVFWVEKMVVVWHIQINTEQEEMNIFFQLRTQHFCLLCNKRGKFPLYSN